MSSSHEMDEKVTSSDTDKAASSDIEDADIEAQEEEKAIVHQSGGAVRARTNTFNRMLWMLSLKKSLSCGRKVIGQYHCILGPANVRII